MAPLLQTLSQRWQRTRELENVCFIERNCDPPRAERDIRRRITTEKWRYLRSPALSTAERRYRQVLRVWLTLLQRRQTFGHGEFGQPCHRVDIQLAHDMFAMGLNGADPHIEPTGNFLVA